MENKCICCNCKFLRPCARATEKGMEYRFVCLANDMGLVDVTELYDMGLGGCIDYQAENEDVAHTNIQLDFKDVQKVAMQCSYLREKEKEKKEDEEEE